MRRRAGGAALGILLAVSACGESVGGPPRCAVLITLDTTRTDALGTYGAPPQITPHLDDLAAQSLVFDNARTVAPITLPAHASMMTGLFPPRHQVRDNGLTPLPQAARTLAERAQEAGLQTAGFVAAIVLSDVYGIDQGFEHFDQPRGETSAQKRFAERSGDQVVAAAIRWLRRRDPDRPFFLWVHLFDPHGPNNPPAAHLERAAGDPYLGDVALMDDAVGELLEALRADPAWPETLVMVVGDHGEGRGEHGEQTHASFVYDSTLRVPMFLRDPGGAGAGTRSAATVSVSDVYPTLVDALALGDAGDVDGLSLYGREVPADRGVYFESYHGLLYFQWSSLAGWVDRRGKYIHSSAPELYGPQDREERRNLLEEGADAEAYRAALRALAARPGLALGPDVVDRDILPALEDLGYAGSAGPTAVPDPLDTSDAPSPHQRAEELRLVMVARFFGVRKQFAQALATLEQVLAINPRNHEALNRKGAYLMALGRTAEAIEALERFTQIGPEWPNVWLNLALCYRAEKRAEQAERWARRALEMDPRNRAALELVVDLLIDAGRSDEAAPFQARLLDL